MKRVYRFLCLALMLAWFCLPVKAEKGQIDEKQWLLDMEQKANFLVNEEIGIDLRKNLKVNDCVTMEFARDDVGHYLQIPNFYLRQSIPEYYSTFEFLRAAVNWFEPAPKGFSSYCLMRVSRDEAGIKIAFSKSPKYFDYSKGDGVWRSHSNISRPPADPYTKKWLSFNERRLNEMVTEGQKQRLVDLIEPGQRLHCNFLTRKDGALKRFDLDSTQGIEPNQIALNILLKAMPFKDKPKNVLHLSNGLLLSNLDGVLQIKLVQSISGRIGENLDSDD